MLKMAVANMPPTISSFAFSCTPVVSHSLLITLFSNIQTVSCRPLGTAS